MTEVTRAEKFRICNICCSKEDVYNITFRYDGTNSGTQVTMCKECINKMVSTLKSNGIIKT